MKVNKDKIEVIEVYNVSTNADLTEGRGRQYVNKVAMTEATAKRVAKRNDVQGSNSSYTKGVAFKYEGIIYTKMGIIDEPTREDIEEQKKLDEAKSIVGRMIDAGFTLDEIKSAASK